MKLLKKTGKIFISLLVTGLLASASAAAGDILESVKETGRIYHRLETDDSEIQLIPDGPYAEQIKTHVFGNYSEKMGFAAESLYYVKKSTLAEKSSNPDKNSIDTSLSAVSKIMRSISKMKGMLYYSNTRKRYEPLYLESYRLESADSTEPVADITGGSAEGKKMFAFLKEHTFGDGVYSVEFRENKKMICMFMENADYLCYGVIKVLKPQGCKVAVNIVDDGDGYIIFIGMSADFVKNAMIEKKMNKSFEARIDAIYDWLILQF